MASIGTGYDLSNSTFSPDGRIFQVEYAGKAVENAGTILGLVCTDGVILAQERLLPSKLLVKGSNRRLGQVQRHIGVATTGIIPDGKNFLNRCRDEAREWTSIFKVPIPTTSLADRMGGYVQAHTLYSSVRPFGICALIAGVHKGKPELFMVEQSGTYWGYKGAAIGKGKQVARAELEKLGDIGLIEGCTEAARIIYMAHEDNKDKDFELEMGWIKNGQWEFVPAELLAPAEEAARKSVEGVDE